MRFAVDSYADFLHGRFPSSLPLFLLRGKVGCASGLTIASVCIATLSSPRNPPKQEPESAASHCKTIACGAFRSQFKMSDSGGGTHGIHGIPGPRGYPLSEISGFPGFRVPETFCTGTRPAISLRPIGLGSRRSGLPARAERTSVRAEKVPAQNETGTEHNSQAADLPGPDRKDFGPDRKDCGPDRNRFRPGRKGMRPKRWDLSKSP